MGDSTSRLPSGLTREAAGVTTDDAVGVTLPVGFRATSDDDGFKLVIHSRPKWAAFMVLFAVLWNGFMIVWFAIAITQGAWMMAAFGSIHGVIGVGVGYAALRGLFNRIEFVISRGRLEVEHRPLPWFAPEPIGRDDIDQLFVEEDSTLKVNDVPVVRYALKLRQKSGKRHKLCVVEERQQAQYLEREIERAFGVEDRAMPREVTKR